MAITTTSLTLPLLLLLYCHGNESFSALATAEKHPDGESTLDDRAASRAKRSKSPGCKPLGGFVSCYDVVEPVFTQMSGDIAMFRSAGMMESAVMTALGRPFRLLLQADPSSGKTDGLKPPMSWSWVLSPSAVVKVMGKQGNVREYKRDELGIKWYVGQDSLEVAPSAVLATVVNATDKQLFRAVIYTISDVYYVEPASAYPEVGLQRSCGYFPDSC